MNQEHVDRGGDKLTITKTWTCCKCQLKVQEVLLLQGNSATWHVKISSADAQLYEESHLKMLEILAHYLRDATFSHVT